MMEKDYLKIRKRTLGIFIFALLASTLGVYAFVRTMEKPSSFHVAVYLQRLGESEPTLISYHAGALTTAGKNFIEGVLGDDGFANATHYIQYGSLSLSATAFNVAWVDIPTEIVADGLERAEMTYASTGNGVWTMTHQWTAGATFVDVQRIGMNWESTANSGSLAWADLITPVTLNSGDKLTAVATTTLSG